MGTLAIVLAAGASRRLGRPKQLVLHRGRPLVRAAAEEALASGCDGVAVVLGAHERTIRPALAGLAVDVLVNESWREGVASSIRRGVVRAVRDRFDAVLLCACDQPALSAKHLARLVRARHAGARTVASRYGGTLGVPALFGRESFPALLGLRGDTGARHLLRDQGAVSIEWLEGERDVDTVDDLEACNRAW